MFLNTDKDVFANFINEQVIKTQSDINSPLPQVREYNGEKFYMSSAFYNNKYEWSDLLSLEKYANITYWHDGSVDVVPMYQVIVVADHAELADYVNLCAQLLFQLPPYGSLRLFARFDAAAGGLDKDPLAKQIVPMDPDEIEKAVLIKDDGSGDLPLMVGVGIGPSSIFQL